MKRTHRAIDQACVGEFYLPGAQHEMAVARAVFLAVVQKQFRQVLETLRDNVLTPLFSRLTPHELVPVDEYLMDGGPFPTVLAAPLEAWSNSHHLNVPWVHEQAICTLVHWREEPLYLTSLTWVRVPPRWKPELFSVNNSEAHESHDFHFRLTRDTMQHPWTRAMLIRDREKLGLDPIPPETPNVAVDDYVWDPFSETRSEYEQRTQKLFARLLAAHMDCLEKEAEAMGGLRSPRGKHRLGQHAQWTAEYQVGGRSFNSLGKLAKSQERSTAGTPHVTVMKAIKEFASAIGLPLRN